MPLTGLQTNHFFLIEFNGLNRFASERSTVKSRHQIELVKLTNAVHPTRSRWIDFKTLFPRHHRFRIDTFLIDRRLGLLSRCHNEVNLAACNGLRTNDGRPKTSPFNRHDQCVSPGLFWQRNRESLCRSAPLIIKLKCLPPRPQLLPSSGSLKTNIAVQKLARGSSRQCGRERKFKLFSRVEDQMGSIEIESKIISRSTLNEKSIFATIQFFAVGFSRQFSERNPPCLLAARPLCVIQRPDEFRLWHPRDREFDAVVSSQ